MVEYLKSPKEKPEAVTDEIRTTVSTILSDVQREGDAAVRRYSEQFDDWSPLSFRVSADEIRRAGEQVEEDVAEATRFTLEQVQNFARLQLESLREFEVETLPGVLLGQKHIPVASVGSYSPGGLYPLNGSQLFSFQSASSDSIVTSATTFRSSSRLS